MAKKGFSDLGFSEMCGSSSSPEPREHGSNLITDVSVCKKGGSADVIVNGDDDRADAALKRDDAEDPRADASMKSSDVSKQTTDVNNTDPGRIRADAGSVGADVKSPRADVTKPVATILNGDNANGTRVSVWERLSQPDGKKSFASIVGCVPKPELEFFPMEKDAKLRVQIPRELTKGMANTYKSVLYGYFLGPRIPFPVVLRAVHNAWGKFGFKDAMLNEHGTFFFQFNDEGGCLQVIESSPLMIKGVPLFIYQWDPSKGLHKPEHTTCPLWIRFHNIPLVAFNREGISRIASAVGVPLRMDACTAATCEKAWGRTNFAKVLVNVWATGKLVREVEVAIPHLLDDGEDVVKVILDYDWEPTQCSSCKVFGHKDSLCPKAPKPPVVGVPQQQKEGDGFQFPRKKQWKPKVITSKHVGTGESSKVKNGEVCNNNDTLMGVGVVKRVVNNGTGRKVVSHNPNIGTPNVDQPKTNSSPTMVDGGFCTLNAGRTPGAKDGMLNKPLVGGAQAEKEGSQSSKEQQHVDNVSEKKDSPTLLQSVVASFKQFERAKRGTPLPVATSNSFDALSSDDSSVDLEVENVND